MHREAKEKDLEMLQQMVRDASPEKWRIFHHCMQTEALVKSALPLAFASSLITHLFIPSKVGLIRPIATIVVGLTTYIYAKISYAPKCFEKAFGKKITGSTAESDGNVDQGDEQDKLHKLYDQLMDEPLIWDNSNTQLESSSNVFKDVNVNLEEEPINEQLENDEKRVTYDKLWMEHKNQQQTEVENLVSRSRTSAMRERVAQNLWHKFAEESATRDAEDDKNKNTWD